MEIKLSCSYTVDGASGFKLSFTYLAGPFILGLYVTRVLHAARIEKRQNLPAS